MYSRVLALDSLVVVEAVDHEAVLWALRLLLGVLGAGHACRDLVWLDADQTCICVDVELEVGAANVLATEVSTLR